MHVARTVRKRLGYLMIVAGVAVPLAVVSVAFACGRLATLHLSAKSARAGAQVSGFGNNYTAAPTASPVTLRFNSRNGAVLWTGRPDLNGHIAPTFAAPSAKPGVYTILALQTTASGAASPGTPGRAALRIRGASASHSSSAGAWAPVPPAAGGGSDGPWAPLTPDLGILAAILSGALLAGGVVVLVSDRRRARQAARVS